MTVSLADLGVFFGGLGIFFIGAGVLHWTSIQARQQKK